MVAFLLCPSLPVVMSPHSALPVLARRSRGLLPPSFIASAHSARLHGPQRSATYSTSPGVLRSVVPTGAAASSCSTAAGRRSVSASGRLVPIVRARGSACALLNRKASASSGGLSLCLLARLAGVSAYATAMFANPSVKGTAEKLRFSVPSALRAPAAPYLQRWAP